MDVLRRMLVPLRPDGLVLDLQPIPPDPLIEVDGRVVARFAGGPMIEMAAAAAAAVDARIAAGELVEEAVDDHDVLEHHADGAELLEDWRHTKRLLRDEDLPAIAAVDRPCYVRERCRLRRLRLVRPT